MLKFIWRDNNLALEKYSLNGSVDNTIGLLNQVKTMIDNAKSSEDLEKAKAYALYAINGLEQQLSKSGEKTKSR